MRTELATKVHVQETLSIPQTAYAAGSTATSNVLAYAAIAATQPENAVLALPFADTACANWAIVPPVQLPPRPHLHPPLKLQRAVL